MFFSSFGYSLIISYLAVYSRADIKEGHSIAFGSCNDAEQLSMWGAIASKRPDTLILLGRQYLR